ncbi:hypothetical protein HA466_0238290 [Hirschfeldia incana]|nr:hypothetical protein HA466_0238290 [Hirschfeldia incana]
MNDPSKLMNPPQMLAQHQRMNRVQPRIMNQAPLLNQSQVLNHPIIGIMNQQPPVMMNNHHRSFKPNNFSSKTNRNNSNRKEKKIYSDKRPPMMDRRPYNPQIGPGGGGGGGYKPPPLNELQSQNRLKTKKFYPKKKYGNNNNNRYVPYAPRNTTSFIIRAKKSGGIAELVSPCTVTPAVLPTPMFSPSREVLGDMAKEEWGVDGYGSMKGLIRLRPDGHDDDEEGGSGESDVEEHVEVERRLDHDLSRFEMIYPSYGGSEYNNVLENRVDDQDSHISQLEEENLTLKERLFLMERGLGDMRRRLQYLETRSMVVGNESESEGGDTGGSDTRISGDSKENHVGAEDVAARDESVAKEVEGKEQGEKDFKEV